MSTNRGCDLSREGSTSSRAETALKRWYNIRVQNERRLKLPLYVPREGEGAIDVLRAQGADAFLSELERLSVLKSAWAGAALGYYYLLPDQNNKRNTARTKNLCGELARSGSVYAQYVLGWALLLEGDREGARRLIAAAMKSGFPPAVLDAGRFAWHGWGLRAPSAEDAERLLLHAQSLGHKGARLLRYEFYLTGAKGTTKQLLGLFCVPVQKIIFAIRSTRDPFSESVFFVNSNADASLFNSARRS